MIALSSNQCPNCQRLKRSYQLEAHQLRKERKEKRTSIKYCNKRYLTKEEIYLQLQEKKKMRQKQLQRQKKSHDAESADDDDDDDDGGDEEESHDDDEEKGDKEEEEDNSGGVEWRIRNDSKGLTLYRV